MSLPNYEHPEQDFENLKKQGVSLVAFLDKVRPRKDNTYTVRLRITHKRIPKYYTTKTNLTEEEWIRVVMSTPRGNLKDKKKTISENLIKANNIIKSMPVFTFEAFTKRFLNRYGDWSNVWFAFEEHINSLKANAKPGTASTYTTANNSFKAYHPKEKFSFDDITVNWLKNYETWMKDNDKSVTTISMNTRCLRRLYNLAINEGEAKRELYPFGSNDHGKYQPPEATNIKKALPKKHLKKIFEYQPQPESPEYYNRDLWIFSYLCNGMNISDIARLKYSNIRNNETLIFIRQKTASKRKLKPVVVELTEQALSIIDRWGMKPRNEDEYIFNILSKGLTAPQQQSKVKQATKQCNKYMKIIAKKIGIDEGISTYYARHSYASVLKLSGEDIAYISESLGHSNIQTTENYLSSFDSEKRKQAAKKLTDF